MLKLIVVLLIFCQSAFAKTTDSQRPLALDDKELVLAGSPGVLWASGERGQFSFDSLQTLHWSPLVLPKDMGQGRNPIWYRFSVQNTTGRAERFILGSMEAHSSDFVVVYIQREDGLVEDLYGGSKLKKDLQARSAASIDFPIRLKPNELITITMGISSNYGRNLLFKLANDGLNRASRVIFHIASGVAFGLFIFAIAFNFLAWLAIRKRYNLIFAFAIAVTLISLFIGQGYSGLLLPFYLYQYGSEILTLSITCSVVLRVWFACEFLDVQKYSKPLHRVMTVFLVLGIFIIALASDASYAFQNMITAYTVTGVVLSAGVAIFVLNKSKAIECWVYLLALVASIIGGKLWLENFTGQQIPNMYGLNTFMITGALETALMTLLFMRKVAGISKQAQESDRNKKEADRMNLLVNVLSHDLKNLTSIIKIAGERILEDPKEESKLTTLSKRIVDTVNRQFAMLASVQNLVHLEKGEVKLNVTAIDLNQAIIDLQELFQEKLKSKNITISVKNQHEYPLLILAERESLLHSVLSNVFYNAIKFSPNGSTITLETESTPSGARFSIHDKGIGMPPIMVERLFQPAYFPSRNGTNGETGSGFGLAICKAFMDMYQGQIEVISRSKIDFPDSHGTSITLIFRHAPNFKIEHAKLEEPVSSPKQFLQAED